MSLLNFISNFSLSLSLSLSLSHIYIYIYIYIYNSKRVFHTSLNESEWEQNFKTLNTLILNALWSEWSRFFLWSPVHLPVSFPGLFWGRSKGINYCSTIFVLSFLQPNSLICASFLLSLSFLCGRVLSFLFIYKRSDLLAGIWWHACILNSLIIVIIIIIT